MDAIHLFRNSTVPHIFDNPNKYIMVLCYPLNFMISNIINKCFVNTFDWFSIYSLEFVFLF
jgi:hypothetical protein